MVSGWLASGETWVAMSVTGALVFDSLFTVIAVLLLTAVVSGIDAICHRRQNQSGPEANHSKRCDSSAQRIRPQGLYPL